MCFFNFRIYIYKKVEVEETVEDMLKTYNIAVNDKKAKLKLLKKLENEYLQEKTDLFEKIKTACEVAKRLEEISLGKSLLTSVDYIARLIRSEEVNNRPNKANRIEQLENFKKKAQLLDDARNNKLEKLVNLTNYEKTVMGAIRIAEVEDTLEEEKAEAKEQKSFMDDPINNAINLITKPFKSATTVPALK